MGEVARVRETLPDLPASRILFTPNFAPRSEYEAALALGTHLTIDGLHPLREWPDLFAGKDIILRVNPDRPRGHHEHVRTAGPKAKSVFRWNSLATPPSWQEPQARALRGCTPTRGRALPRPDTGARSAGYWVRRQPVSVA